MAVGHNTGRNTLNNYKCISKWKIKNVVLVSK